LAILAALLERDDTGECVSEAAARMAVERKRGGAAVDDGRGSVRGGAKTRLMGLPMSWSRPTATSLPLGIEINILLIKVSASTNIYITIESQNLN
jgi:hypothetical protein